MPALALSKIGMQVLYEDNHLIAVYKPAGILVQADRSGTPTLMDMVKTYLKQKYNKPGRVFLGLLHRLDKPTSGIVLFAKTSKGASRLSAQFRERRVNKWYHAQIEGTPTPAQATLLHYLKKNESARRMEVYEQEIPGARRAELTYTLVQTNGKTSLVRVELHTGRKHQIRAQFGHIGHPVVGDVQYGATTALPDGSIRLIASSLSFLPATREGEKRIEIALPEWAI